MISSLFKKKSPIKIEKIVNFCVQQSGVMLVKCGFLWNKFSVKLTQFKEIWFTAWAAFILLCRTLRIFGTLEYSQIHFRQDGTHFHEADLSVLPWYRRSSVPWGWSCYCPEAGNRSVSLIAWPLPESNVRRHEHEEEQPKRANPFINGNHNVFKFSINILALRC